jgi:RHS repeat-associated protein
VPGTVDNVTIGLRTKSPVLDANRTIGNLTFSQQTLDLNGFSLIANGTSTLTSGLVKNGSLTVSNVGTLSPGTIVQGSNTNMLTLGSTQVSTAFTVTVTGAGYSGNAYPAGGSNGYLYLFPSLPTGSNTSLINITINNPSNKNQFKTLELVINSQNQIVNANIVDEGDSYPLPATLGGVYDNQTYVDLSAAFLSLFGGPCAPNTWTEGNFVRTQSLQIPVTDPTTVAALPVESMVQTTEYLDGLGRPLETVTKQFSPQKRDLVQVYERDAADRTQKEYLPFVTDVCAGTYIDITVAKTQQRNFYTVNDDPLIPKVVDPLLYNGTQNNTYHQAVYDNSPMERVVEGSAPGDPWKLITDGNGISTSAGHTAKSTYRANLANEVLLWSYSDATGNASAASGSAAAYYAANSLFVVETMDENWNPSTQTGGRTSHFTDMEGRLILKRERKDASTNHDTYYIYDDFGLLRYVVPPQASSLLSGQTWTITLGSTFANTWLFSYQYDARHRISSKKIPGVTVVNILYDLLDRPVIIQDGNQATSHQWQFFKYDVLGRNILHGVYTDNTATLATLQTSFNSVASPYEKRSFATGILGYTNSIVPTAITANDVYTVNYYDDYDFDYNGTADYSYASASLRSIGLVTGTKNSLLSAPTTKLTKAYFYDKYGRVVQTQGNNHLYLVQNPGSTVLADLFTTVYDWSGKVMSTTQVHTPGVTGAMTIQRQYTYDHMGRLLTLTQQNNGDLAVLVSQHNYNELGEEIEKNLHSENSGATFLQSVDYRRNIRGWLTSINNSSLTNDAGFSNDDNNDLFGITLSYQDNFSGLNTPKFNGNISALRWKSNNSSLPTSATEKAYLYAYDDVNRLLSASYASNGGGAWLTGTQYAESMVYDANGNISNLSRSNSASSPIDNLTLLYTGTGNQLSSVSDAGNATVGFLDNVNTATEYGYDANGNMTSNSNAYQTLQYNYLNLPTSVTQSGQTLAYSYDAGGRKLTKSVTDAAGHPNYAYHYVDGFVYTQVLSSCTSNCYTFNFVANEEGRVHLVGTALRYEYDLKDHLGNVRVTFDKGGSGSAALIQEDHYYPFGMKMDALSYDNGSGNRYLYNGKELQQELNMYDYGARMYDPTVGRWTSIDPVARLYESHSPYNYVFNNPSNWKDPDGRCPTCPKGKNADEVYEIGANVENKDGSWNYLGEGKWHTNYIMNKTTGQPYATGSVEPVQIEFAMLAPASLPFRTSSKLINFGLETINPIGGLGLAKGGRNMFGHLSLGSLPSLPVRSLNYNKIIFTEKGVGKVVEHLSRFGPDAANAKMIERLKGIANGTIEATDADKKFYSHELREMVRYRNGGVNDAGSYDFYSTEHAATLRDYGIPVNSNAKFELYHPDAIDAAGTDF